MWRGEEASLIPSPFPHQLQLVLITNAVMVLVVFEKIPLLEAKATNKQGVAVSEEWEWERSSMGAVAAEYNGLLLEHSQLHASD